ncbi:MAG TPA: cation transporter, partial [Mycobacteriales bacterium]|nr:cation transporter [Mycobacteriales bacterium]
MTAPTVREVELVITGMTCGSCAAGIERALNEVPGVEATVNYATERARIRFPDSLATADLVAVVADVGYAAAPPPTVEEKVAEDESDPAVALRRRLIVTTAFALPVLLLSMIPALRFGGWEELALALT